MIKIAIIGSGVGGASTCYFLRELLHGASTIASPDSTVTIDMYEKHDYVGGRVRGVNLESYCGGTYMKDIGATIIIKQNQYMVNFAKDILGLPLVEEKSDLGFAFFDEPLGKLSTTFDNKWGTLSLIRSWGLLPFLALMWNARSFIHNFGQIYALQAQHATFENALDFWAALKLDSALYGNGMQYVNDAIDERIPSLLASPETERPWHKVCLQLVTALTRNNYTQEPSDLSPLVVAGAVSTLAANGLCYVANGGNSLIERGLIEASSTNLFLNFEITNIRKDRATHKYILNDDAALQYDYVVIATPLCLSKIAFDISDDERTACNQQIEVLSQQEYVDVYKHYVKGRLNPRYFGVEDGDAKRLENIGTIFSSNDGSMVGDSPTHSQRVTFKKLPCTTIGNLDENAWLRFMGSEKFTEQTLDELLLDWDKESLQQFHFKAYPKYKWNRDHIDCLSVEQQKTMLRFCMDRKSKEDGNGGLYYVNVLESGMSAQEVLAVSGNNVALLMYKQMHAASPVI